MSLNKLFLFTIIVATSSVFGLTGCGKSCNASETEKNIWNTKCDPPASSPVRGYNIYVSSGFPTASGVGIISRWTSSGAFLDIVHDFATASGFMPQAVTFQTISGIPYMFSLAYNGTYGEIESSMTNGTGYGNYISNTTALGAGSRRLANTTDGGFLVTRTAGTERFNSAKQRLGASARYATTGACTVTLGSSAAQLTLSGVDYVVVSNAATTPNNKINLFNGSSGACISGVAPVGPATTMWPVDMDYSASENKLFVLYYPFTAATTNAQILSFDVTAGAVNNGTLLYDDIYADIATVSATPAALASSIVFHRTSTEAFVLVGTSNNSVMKYSYSASALTKVGSVPLIFQSSLIRAISSVNVLDY